LFLPATCHGLFARHCWHNAAFRAALGSCWRNALRLLRLNGCAGAGLQAK